MKKVVIVGGGISGLCSAYYLVKEGYEVSVIDQGDISTGASFINAGYLTPSHFTPLAEPGMITKGLQWMLRSSSPFYIKPRFDMEFFKWAFHFKKSATLEKVEKAIPVLTEINLKSRDLYESMLESLDFDFHYERKGLLMVYKNTESEKHELKLAERAVNEGLEAKNISKEELKKRYPIFSDEVIGAVHYECDAHTTPNEFMKNLKSWLEKQGVRFILHQEVKEIVSENNRIIAVKTQGAVIEGDEFILAAGCWTSSLAKSLKINIPIQGGKGYSINVQRPMGITIPAILVEAKVAVTPMKDFTRFAGTMEFSGMNSIIRKPRVKAIADSVQDYYRNIVITEEERDAAVSGLRPVSPDGLPFIGRTSAYKNLTIAAGHAMMGWSLGPITGKLITEVISGSDTSVKLDPFKVERFN
ncbi:amino acid dehydrogenase [Salinimicrobium marinum]|uniref:Amino acid dehydrogenase n=1 Tax=Salinimicrobium marinum TaxID=680283 RepID=A0A918SJN1_9FLAO|nr:FAD-dependent oxidoreductase [Salinimicrobium marinum]GHA46710.1 amino acid dehydrogenase [Salinimicrobium marinum]